MCFPPLKLIKQLLFDSCASSDLVNLMRPLNLPAEEERERDMSVRGGRAALRDPGAGGRPDGRRGEGDGRRGRRGRKRRGQQPGLVRSPASGI